MRRALGIVGLGLAGIVLAVALSLGAFAIAGSAVGEPATAVHISTPLPHSPTDDRSSPVRAHTPSAPASPSDNHGGGSSPEPADDHGNLGHGSDD